VNLLGRIARLVAPLPETATHSVEVSLAPALLEHIPSEPIPRASVLRITNGIVTATDGISPDLLFTISGTQPLSPFTPLRADRAVSAPDFSSLFPTWVSGNLFERLERAGIVGADYANRNRKKPAQPKPAESADQNGFTKAYSRTKSAYGISTHTVVSLSIWDLIYPTLLPPIAVEFTPDLDVLHKLRPYQQVGVKFHRNYRLRRFQREPPMSAVLRMESGNAGNGIQSFGFNVLTKRKSLIL
jgi:hypothetical protein